MGDQYAHTRMLFEDAVAAHGSGVSRRSCSAEEQSMAMTRAANLWLSFERFERMVASNTLAGNSTGQTNAFGIAATATRNASANVNAKAHTNSNAIYWRALSALD